jgi:hypothetical protein
MRRCWGRRGSTGRSDHIMRRRLWKGGRRMRRCCKSDRRRYEEDSKDIQKNNHKNSNA